MSLRTVSEHAGRAHLEVFGGLHPTSADGLPADIRTILLLGPREPGFWAHVAREPELADGDPDGLDRWSERVVGQIATAVHGEPFFPFGGPPYQPFIAWARASGEAWTSDVGLLVHVRAGLMISDRGAIGLRERLDLPAHGTRPCDDCAEKPCLTACPVGALNGEGYDIPACKHYLGLSDGRDCMEQGCAVRRACPVGAAYERLPEQSAYHMRHFRT